MNKLSGEQLHKHLRAWQQAPAFPAYLVVGDEPLLVQEAVDALRAQARKLGFSERQSFQADSQFDWGEVADAASSLSLFASRRLVEVRLINDKFTEAAGRALETYAQRANPDTLLIVSGPRLDKNALKSVAYQALLRIGALVQIWPVDPKAMPAWLTARLKRAGLSAEPEAVALLAERVQGNLLAAQQEVEKLALLAPEGPISASAMAEAVADSARFHIFGLLDHILQGNARNTMLALDNLREGGDAMVVIAMLAREVRQLIDLKRAQGEGRPLEVSAREFRLHPARLPLLREALKRLSPAALDQALAGISHADRQMKGAAPGDVWQQLIDVALLLALGRSVTTFPSS